MADGSSFGRGASLLAAVLAGGVLFLLSLVAERRSPDADPLPSFPDSDYVGLDPASGPGDLLVGTNYTHHSLEGCAWAHRGIVRTYRHEGVAAEVHDQLRRMRRTGVESLRLLVWHMRDTRQHAWGVVPSRGGRLPEPFRGNLVAFVGEVRRFGFHRLSVSFGPQWANDPREDVWDPERFEENWAFIRDVRSLVLEHGPDRVRFDLLNEGAPSDHTPLERRERVMDYLGRMWRRYTATFGAADATVSVIAPETPRDRGRRLENLLAALGERGAPLPTWIELHVNYQPNGVAWGLRYADSVLTDRGMGQPLTIGETSYDDAAVADAIETFMAASERPVEEVVQWFKRAGADCEVSPPYRVDAFLGLDRGDLGRHRPASAPLTERKEAARGPRPRHDSLRSVTLVPSLSAPSPPAPFPPGSPPSRYRIRSPERFTTSLPGASRKRRSSS